MSRRFLVPVMVAACSVISGDLDRIVAIEIVGSLSPQIAVGDTLQLRARALTAAGDSVAEALIVWQLLDLDSGQVGFTLDTATGVVAGESAGSGRVAARVETLQSGIITITVVAPPAPSVRHGTRAERFDRRAAPLRSAMGGDP